MDRTFVPVADVSTGDPLTSLRNEARRSHLETLVRCLLPFSSHGVRRRLGEGPQGSEDDEAHGDANEGVERHFLILVGGGEGPGAVGTKSDPVSCPDRQDQCLEHLRIDQMTAENSPPTGTDKEKASRGAFAGYDLARTKLTHRPSSPESSTPSNSRASGHEEPSTARPALAVACPPIASRCWPASGWKSHASKRRERRWKARWAAGPVVRDGREAAGTRAKCAAWRRFNWVGEAKMAVGTKERARMLSIEAVANL